MAHSPSSSAENLPTRFQNTAARTRYYNVVAQNKIWEEQGFFFDDGAQNYGLETIIYKRLFDLGWFHLGRKAAQANLNWVMEFYAHNVAGEDTVTVRGRRVPADSATINSILDLPNNLPSIYELIGALEEEDFDNIKDQLWNRMEHNRQESRDHQPPASPARGQTLEHICQAQYHAHFPQSDSGPNSAGASQCHHLWLPLQPR
ncbi:hypothetical protein V6N11_058469 [Hibiscus sabdariffa]|uniref:Uncharacterized protein n=1 Tax=Hibiscus sabdariffa TaxID=183260 RepID=A0ABR2U4W8_9ROSI